MRKFFLIGILLFSVSIVYGGGFAIDGGAFHFSGEMYLEMGFGSAYYGDTLVFAPGVHWFIFKGLSLGIDVHTGSYTQSGTKLSVDRGFLTLQYFLGSRETLIFPFAGVGMGGGGKEIGSVKYSFESYRIMAGVCFMLNDNIGIKTYASYIYDKIGESQGPFPKSNAGVIRLGFSVLLAIF